MGLFTKKPPPQSPVLPPTAEPSGAPPAHARPADGETPARCAVADVTRDLPGALSKVAKGTSFKERQAAERVKKFYELKSTIHRKLVDQLDMSKLNAGASEELRHQIHQVVLELCEEEDTLLGASERQRLAQEVLDETFGLGPLETLLKDPRISDILINGPQRIYVERGGRLLLTDVKFKDDGHLLDSRALSTLPYRV